MQRSQEPTPSTDRAGTASSQDGRRLDLHVPLESGLPIGSIVTVTDDAGVQVGQVHDLSLSSDGSSRGSGSLLGALADDGSLTPGATRAFGSAVLAPAAPDVSTRLFGGSGELLELGTLRVGHPVPVGVLAARLNRHTFWCGQSGSGKTYALGVLLEQVLLHTRLPMVILDPNSDFVALGERAGTASTAAGRAAQDELQHRNVRVLRPRPGDHEALRVRFTALSMEGKAAVLRLDPVADRDEYNELVHLELEVGSQDTTQIVPQLRTRDSAAARALSARVENLGLLGWDLWAREHRAAAEVLDERPDATVLDLAGFSNPDEYLVVAMSVLDDLWAKRERRRPLLIVIDEAHNLCPSDDGSPLQNAVRDRIVQIAAEGRKYGLWLLLSTQRPAKVQRNVISQCDNLALMRMSSPSDIAELATLFGFVPVPMLEESPFFRQGEALLAGGFVPAPTAITMGERLTRQGGGDVRVPLRS